MMNQFSPKVSEILSFSREEAERLTSKSVAPEHIMLAILREKSGPVWELFNQWKIDIDNIKKEVFWRKLLKPTLQYLICF